MAADELDMRAVFGEDYQLAKDLADKCVADTELSIKRNIELLIDAASSHQAGVNGAIQICMASASMGCQILAGTIAVLKPGAKIDTRHAMAMLLLVSGTGKPAGLDSLLVNADLLIKSLEAMRRAQ